MATDSLCQATPEPTCSSGCSEEPQLGPRVKVTLAGMLIALSGFGRLDKAELLLFRIGVFE